MPKYKQKYIPSITTTAQKSLRPYANNYYKENIQGKTVVNRHHGLTIYFGSEGRSEIAYGRAMYPKKAAILQCLPKLMEIAEYNGWGQKKDTDGTDVWGYAIFKAKVIIDGKTENVRLVVKVKANGKGYYCHEVNIKKN